MGVVGGGGGGLFHWGVLVVRGVAVVGEVVWGGVGREFGRRVVWAGLGGFGGFGRGRGLRVSRNPQLSAALGDVARRSPRCRTI